MAEMQHIPLVSILEGARAAGKHYNTLTRWVKTGQLTEVGRVNGKRLFRLGDILARAAISHGRGARPARRREE
jgi:DNA-binding transcriptional MerR regulator